MELTLIKMLIHPDETSTLVANNNTGTAGTLTQTSFSTVTSTNALSTVYPVSTDPHGFIFQTWIGRRNARSLPPVPNKPADVTAVDLSKTNFVLPCPPGQVADGSCNTDTLTTSVRATAS